MKVADALIFAADTLKKSGVSDPAREASSLLQFALARERVFLVAHSEYDLTGDEHSRFVGLVERRASREPMQYIKGMHEFFGLDFLVTPDVLVPRPETEMLVERSIEILGGTAGSSFAEIGVGSGCISIAILHNVGEARGDGFEISPAAIEIAAQNARKHGVADRLRLNLSDLFENFGDVRYDLIVSNPPYVSTADIAGLQPEVALFEPRVAVTDGRDGLSIIRAIVKCSPTFLAAGGHLILEIGIGQGDAVTEMFDRAVWGEVELAVDFRGIPRMVMGHLEKPL